MDHAGVKTHVLLGRDFATPAVALRNRMPDPLHILYLDANHPRDVATCVLLEGSLRYYPLEIEDFLRGDQLRAYFRCSAKDKVVTTRFTRGELEVQERMLIPYADEVVAGWNLVQLRAAQILMDNAPDAGRAVPIKVIESFCRAPQSFYKALISPPAPGRH